MNGEGNTRRDHGKYYHGILNWKGEILEGGLELPILNKNIQNFDDRLITYDLLTHHSTQWRHQ